MKQESLRDAFFEIYGHVHKALSWEVPELSDPNVNNREGSTSSDSK